MFKIKPSQLHLEGHVSRNEHSEGHPAQICDQQLKDTQFYHLIKTHKAGPVTMIHPIVAYRGGPNSQDCLIDDAYLHAPFPHNTKVAMN